MATLTLEDEKRDGVHVLHLHGRLTLGEGTTTFRDAIKSQMASGSRQLVLDLADIKYVDSAGIGELVSAYTSVTSQGGRFVLVALQKRVIDLLQITKLFTVFKVFETVDQAVEALRTPPAP
jgi:anti-sigma B factor antagonist